MLPSVSTFAHCPSCSNHVDALIEVGTLGTELPNAADYQIATSVRLLLCFDDLRETLEPGQQPTTPADSRPTSPAA